MILPAAGSGSRYAADGGGSDKLLADIVGQSVLQRSVGLFATRRDVGLIVIVTARERLDAYRQHLQSILGGSASAADRRLRFVAGGRERWESVLLGLRALKAEQHHAHYVAIHDAARPLAPASVIDEAFAAAMGGGALPCVPEPATLKRQNAEGNVAETIDRRGLYQAQTPQCFDLARLLAGYESLQKQGALADLTDDAQVFERMGWPVAITPGSPLNLKITTPADLALARAFTS